MSNWLPDHEWHDDIDWADLPPWIRENEQRMGRLRHGDELNGQNVSYKAIDGKLMRRLNDDVLVITSRGESPQKEEGGSTKMPFQRAPFNNTSIIAGGNRLTGSSDAIFLRNKYQVELDNANAALVNMVHSIEETSGKWIAIKYHKAQALEKDIVAHLTERSRLYEALSSLLEKELGQEYKMWKESPQGLRVNTKEGLGQRGNQTGLVVSDSSSILLKYLERYPELGTKTSFSALTTQLTGKERSIREKQEDYNKATSEYNEELTTFQRDLQKCEDKLLAYESLLDEWKDQIKSHRYFGSFWFKILPEYKKATLLPDTIQHRIPQFKHTLEDFQTSLEQYTIHKFIELKYYTYNPEIKPEKIELP